MARRYADGEVERVLDLATGGRGAACQARGPTADEMRQTGAAAGIPTEAVDLAMMRLDRSRDGVSEGRSARAFRVKGQADRRDLDRLARSLRRRAPRGDVGCSGWSSKRTTLRSNWRGRSSSDVRRTPDTMARNVTHSIRDPMISTHLRAAAAVIAILAASGCGRTLSGGSPPVSTESCQEGRIEVMILGTFHFAQQDEVDPLSSRCQTELAAILDRLEEFAPGRIASSLS